MLDDKIFVKYVRFECERNCVRKNKQFEKQNFEKNIEININNYEKQ